MMLNKSTMYAALTAFALLAAPAMAQTSGAMPDNSSPAHSAQLHSDPATANDPVPAQAANPNGPSNAVPGAAAKNVLQNRGGSGSGN
jgi:hypothetical protein